MKVKVKVTPEGGQPFWDTVTDVTAKYRDRKDRPLDKEWTEVVLIGKREDQDTVEDLLPDARRTNWLIRQINQRFYRFPDGIIVHNADATSGQKNARTAQGLEHHTLHECRGDGRYEEVAATHPYYGLVTIRYCKLRGSVEANREGNSRARTMEAYGIGTRGDHICMVWKNECYEMVTGWSRISGPFGVTFGSANVAVQVLLPDTSPVKNNTYRDKLLRRDDTVHGHRQVVRNGHLPARTITTGVGPVEVQQPRVHDRRPAAEREKFTSAILPPYLRKTKSIEELIPWLYLKGVSTGDFREALAALLGPDAKGLSATTVTRLKGLWEKEYHDWSQRSLAGKQYVYVWADGVYFNIRLEGGRQCVLVLLGATADGQKELIAIQDGQRESEQSWKELLLDIRARGLTIDPTLAIGDGALGFWKALRQVWPEVQEQRCWVHKTANVLDKLPKGVQPKAKRMLHEIYQAPSRAEAEKAFGLFLRTYAAKYPKATECLAKDRHALLTFYDFPAEHWMHLRTTNPIESVFATVRLRTEKTKGSGTREACLTMVFKLMGSAAKRWRSLNGAPLLADVIAGVVFKDGVREDAA